MKKTDNKDKRFKNMGIHSNDDIWLIGLRVSDILREDDYIILGYDGKRLLKIRANDIYNSKHHIFKLPFSIKVDKPITIDFNRLEMGLDANISGLFSSDSDIHPTDRNDINLFTKVDLEDGIIRTLDGKMIINVNDMEKI